MFLAFYVGFGILAGIWPLHTWSPDGHASAPTAVSMLHAGVLMKLGAYAILRIALDQPRGGDVANSIPIRVDDVKAAVRSCGERERRRPRSGRGPAVSVMRLRSRGIATAAASYACRVSPNIDSTSAVAIGVHRGSRVRLGLVFRACTVPT